MHIFNIFVLYRKNKRTVDEERVDTMMATLKKEKEREAEMNKQVETKENRRLYRTRRIYSSQFHRWFVQKHSFWRLSFSQSKLYLHSLTETYSPQLPPFQLQSAHQIHWVWYRLVITGGSCNVRQPSPSSLYLRLHCKWRASENPI